MTDHGKREFDIIVHGATGYTGKLIANYLASTIGRADRPADKELTWAVSGRSSSKLVKLAAECQEVSPSKAKPDVIVADSLDEAQMNELAKRARVVIACAGPFSKYGMPLVAACVAAKTHYVDITGEYPFVREVIEKYHDAAVANGVLLMPCSGFDSVPSDLGNAWVHESAKKMGRGDIVHVEGAFAMNGGGASRGTLESVLNIANAMRRADRNPLSLVPLDRRDGVVTPKTTRPRYSAALKQYVGPFFMAPINERVVRRSNSLGGSLRRSASYVEMMTGSQTKVIVSYLTTFFMALLFVPGLRQLFQRFVFPAPGEGPKGDGNFRGYFTGYTSRDANAAPALQVQMACEVEGYKFTAISASEIAKMVACNEVNGVVGGVVGAGSSFPNQLVDRLCRSGKIAITASH